MKHLLPARCNSISRRNNSDQHVNTDYTRRCLTLLVLPFFLSVSSHSTGAEQNREIDDRFTRSIYAGAGMGFSVLEPNTRKIAGWDLNDTTGTGGQIQLGIDLFKQMSLEFHSARLGSAGLSPSGRIKYDVNALSALIYAGGNRDRFKRTGLTAYGRGGFGVLRNSAAGEVPFRTIDANHLLWGAGVEYMHMNGFGARAEVISVAEDVRYGQLGMIYRFGQPRYVESSTEALSAESSVEAADNSEQVVRNDPPLPPPPPPPILEHSAPEPVAKNECSTIDGEIDGIRFDIGAADLTVTARSVLDSVAATLAKCPELPLTVSAHTDSLGSEKTNFILSHRRAWAVINYLRSAGVNLLRMTPRAFGETRPVDNNDTESGRRNNRRVELIANNPGGDGVL